MTALRVRTSDIEWYGGNIDRKVQEAQDGFLPAVGRLRSHVPRFSDLSDT